MQPTSDCRPSSADFSIASTATDGVSPMVDWKRSRGHPPKTWLKQITVGLDTTTADALQLATDRPTWRTVTMATRLRTQWWWWWWTSIIIKSLSIIMSWLSSDVNHWDYWEHINDNNTFAALFDILTFLSRHHRHWVTLVIRGEIPRNFVRKHIEPKL